MTLGFINGALSSDELQLICDMIATYNLDVLAIAETWIRDDDTDAIKRDSALDGYNIMHTTRPSRTKRSRGGGLCLIYRGSMKVKPQHATDYKSFECQLVKIACTENKTNDYITMAIIYRPPTTGPDTTFLD